MGPALYGKLYGADDVIGVNPLKVFVDKYDDDPGCADPVWKICANQYLSHNTRTKENIFFYGLCHLSPFFVGRTT